MTQEAMTYFSPAVGILSKTFFYKQGVLIPISVSTGITLELISYYLLETQFLGVTTGFLVLIGFLYILDFVTGALASSHESKVHKKNGEEKEAKEKKFQSSKMTFTFFKFMMLFLWIWLAHSISMKIPNVEWLIVSYEALAIIPLVLVCLREYVSIGENLERVYGKKPYIFELVEKIFDTLQAKFLKKLGKDAETKKEEKVDETLSNDED